MTDKLFENETSVFKNKLNNILTDKPQADLIRDILTLILLRNSYKDEKILKLIDVYNAVGLDNFMSIIESFNGETISFPSVEEFKETVITAIAYYYKHVQNKSWKEIKDILDTDESFVKCGISCSKLEMFISELEERHLFNEGKYK
ncbi:MAG: hypothetical protein IKK93_00230 [Campylobacter sp.]|nr:hypothetical protein [Campylobacter sp.]